MAASTTKERILQLLAQQTCPAETLARRLGLSRVAVQRHLRELLAQGRVRYEDRRGGGRGRPRRYWRAVAPAEAAAGYCAVLLQVLRNRLGEAAYLRFLVEVEERRIAGVGGMEGLVSRLREQGYAPRLGEGVLDQATCPRLVLARRHPELCHAEAEAYHRLLGVPVRLIARIPDGSPICRFTLGGSGALGSGAHRS